MSTQYGRVPVRDHVEQQLQLVPAHSALDHEVRKESLSETNRPELLSRIESIPEKESEYVKLSGNAKHWNWEQVRKWLTQRNLKEFIQGFEIDGGIEGAKLLDMSEAKLIDVCITKLDISREKADEHPLAWRFIRGVSNLKLLNQAQELELNGRYPEMAVKDLIEMELKINLFIEKWDRILWIEYYEETNGNEPSLETVMEELELPEAVASVYLHYYAHMDRNKNKDLSELLKGFNVYEDAVIWWSIIISMLNTYPSKSLWLIFGKVAEFTPGAVAIQLLETYKLDLNRFDASKLAKVCQGIVVGSRYPVCAGLRIAKWFYDRAEYEEARRGSIEEIAKSYIEAATEYISLIESDHLATILLEVKSDIEGMSAVDMAESYDLQDFVTNARVERVTTSIMNNFEFLKPENRTNAFQIDQLSLELIWKQMWNSHFYLTPLGVYVTTVVLYLLYLAFFTYLSITFIQVYDPMEPSEAVFWILNIGYVLNEGQHFLVQGRAAYLQDVSNSFDLVISALFVATFGLRIYALIKGSANCGDVDDDCWTDGRLNTAFIILWGSATITLWLRLFNFCVLSHSLGPMVQMIFGMMTDIATFFKIMLILFLGFTFAMMFILGSVRDDFASPLSAGLTLFTAIIDGFDFDSVVPEDGEDTNVPLLYFGYFVAVMYSIIGSIVLLNLLVAMMATTYESVSENVVSVIISVRFRLAVNLEKDAAFMPPPLNILVMVLFPIFYVIEYTVNFFRVCVCRNDTALDLTALMLPPFLKQRKFELDDQILWKNCHRAWYITTNVGLTRCKVTQYDALSHQHYVRFYDTKEDEYNDSHWKPIEVSVDSDVQKKHGWRLDFMRLHELGLIDLAQFEGWKMDNAWINTVHQERRAAQRDGTESPYWICGFCRAYVKESSYSIKRLARLLNVNEVELKIVDKVSPVVCPNCYRARFERARWEFVWELISLYIFYILVIPILVVLSAIIALLGMLMSPSSIGMYWEMIKESLCSSKQPKERDAIATESNHEYMTGHYSDNALMTKMSETTQQHAIFDASVAHPVWQGLHDAKDAIDPSLLMMRIDEHIMSISCEDELAPQEFYWCYVNALSFMGKQYEYERPQYEYGHYGGRWEEFGSDDEVRLFVNKNGYNWLIWKDYLLPLSFTIFSKIHDVREDHLPLSLFARYPFDVSTVVKAFERHFEAFNLRPYRAKEKDDTLQTCHYRDIEEALKELKFLNDTGYYPGGPLLRMLANSATADGGNAFTEFTKLLVGVSELFQKPRKIKNMLRDVNTAIIERGADAVLVEGELQFMAEIANERVARAFFNFMRTEMTGKDYEKKLELWTIRNTLMILDFLHQTVREHVLENHHKVYMSIDEVLDLVFKQHSDDDAIIDPETEEQAETDENIENEEKKNDEDEDEEEDDDEDEDEDEKKDEEDLGAAQFIAERQKIAQERMQIYYKEEIKASDVQMEVSSMFEKLQRRRKQKVSENTIDYYRREGLKHVVLLQDDECLRYIYEQLGRYITFNQSKAAQALDSKMLMDILCTTLKFGDKYRIDEEAIPLKIAGNEKNVQVLYEHLLQIWNDTWSNDQDARKWDAMRGTIKPPRLAHLGDKKRIWVDEYDDEDPYWATDPEDGEDEDRTMRLQDAMSIILLYQRIFTVAKQKMLDSADEFVINHDLFCKFVDPEFEIGAVAESKTKWSPKTRAASNLYQTVLDGQRNFVTLGQIGQTVDALIEDLKKMRCGEMMRLRNHLHVKEEWDRRRSDLFKIGEGDDDDDDVNQHITAGRWSQFVATIARSFQINIDHETVDIAHTQQRKPDQDEEKESPHKDEGQETLLGVILKNTSFDIIDISSSDREDDVAGAGTAESAKNEEEDNEEMEMEMEDEEAAKARKNVFRTVLSFNSQRVTLWQIIVFSRRFRLFLNRYTAVNKLMTRYDKAVQPVEEEENAEKEDNLKETILEELKQHKIGLKTDFDTFRQEYFGSSQESEQMKLEDEYGELPQIQQMKVEDFQAEIEWLYKTSESEFDLCRKMHMFWSPRFVKEISEFEDRGTHIPGNSIIYQFECAEFASLAHQSLNVNADGAEKLFFIIRFKERTLTWQQLHYYLRFLLEMKCNIESAIIEWKQAEDTTVSHDTMRAMLKIALNDESKWLFDRVQSLHCNTVTWRHIRNYLKKVVAAQQTMSGFFEAQERDQNYEENQAEIIDEISANMEESKETASNQQEEMMDLLKAMKKEIETLKEKLDAK